MHLSRVRILVPTLLAAFAVAGCESSTLSSEEFQGTFVLETFRGDPVPARVETSAFDWFLLADTMRLGPGGDARRNGLVRVDFHDPAGSDNEQVLDHPFEYRVRGGRLEVNYHCAPNELCPGLRDVGTHEGDKLVVDFGDGARHYRRIED